MERKNISQNQIFLKFNLNKEKNIKSNKSFKKTEIKSYAHSNKTYNKNKTISKIKKEQNNITNVNDCKNKNHQKQIKKYLFKNVGIFNKNKNNNNNNLNYTFIKEFNGTDTKSKKQNFIINEFKKEDNTNSKKNNDELDNIYMNTNGNINITINPNTNINWNLKGNESIFKPNQQEQKKYNSNIDLFYFLNNNKKNKRKSNMMLAKSFNKRKINDKLINSEYINFNDINVNNNNNESFYENTPLKNKNNNYIYKNYNNNINSYKNNKTIETYDNYTIKTNNKALSKNNKSTNSSKHLIYFKSIKTFYAHLEILISLYLKRNLKDFIEKIKENKLEENSNKNNQTTPIINVNNAHCSLYCSININQNQDNQNNKILKTLLNKNNHNDFINENIYNVPMSKKIDNEYENDNINLINKKIFDNVNNKKNKNIIVNTIQKMNLSLSYKNNNNSKKNEKENENDKTIKTINKSVYIPKNKIIKYNNNDKKINNNNVKINLINDYKVNSNVKGSSPIKEMNIKLKKINVCRLNELNQLFSNQKLMNNNTNSIDFNKMQNMVQNYNNNTINTNIINTLNINGDKNKVRKIVGSKSGIYIKPKEKEKIIKEIKIQKKKNMITPYKNDNIFIDTKEIKSEIKNDCFKNSDFINKNNSCKQDKIIKKIIISTNLKNLNNNKNNNNTIECNNNIISNNKSNRCLSTILSFKNIKEKNNNQKILIKQIITSDKRIFINVNYYILNNNDIKNKNTFNSLIIKESWQCSISIINNALFLFTSEYEKEKHNIEDIFRFDNDDKTKGELKIKKTQYEKEKEKFYQLKNIIKKHINKKYMKLFFDRYKKFKLLRKIILIKNQKILYYYLAKFNKGTININKNIDKNNSIYHKINYNDDFNLTKKTKAPNERKINEVKEQSIKKNYDDYINNNNNIHCKTKAYNLSTKNHINKNKSNINNKKKGKEKESLSINNNNNCNSTQKYINKEINIFVHK